MTTGEGPFRGLGRAERVRASRRGTRSRLAHAVAALSAGAGIVHLSVVAEHVREDPRFGAFFVALAVFQLGWSALVVARPTRSAFRVGAAVNGAVVVVWAVSRTVGIPFGPHAGVPEAIGMADLVSTGLEAAILVGSVAMAGTTARIYAATARAFVAIAIASVPLIALASTASGHDGTVEAGTSTPHHDADRDHHGPGGPHGHAEPEPHPISNGED